MKKLIVSIIVLIITKSISKTSVIVDIIYDDKSVQNKSTNNNINLNNNSDVDKKKKFWTH